MKKVLVVLLGLGLLPVPMAMAQSGEPPSNEVAISTGGPAPLGPGEVLRITAALQPDYVKVPNRCRSGGVLARLVITHAATGVVVTEGVGLVSEGSRVFDVSYELPVGRDATGRPVPFQVAALVPRGTEACIGVTVDVLTQGDTRLETKFTSVAATVQQVGPADGG